MQSQRGRKGKVGHRGEDKTIVWRTVPEGMHQYVALRSTRLRCQPLEDLGPTSETQKLL